MPQEQSKPIWARILEPLYLGLSAALAIGIILFVIVVIGGMFLLLMGDRLGLLDLKTTYELEEPGGVFKYLWAQIVFGAKVFGGAIVVFTPLIAGLSFVPIIGRWLRDDSYAQSPSPSSSAGAEGEGQTPVSLQYVDQMSGYVDRQTDRAANESAQGGVDINLDWLE